MIHNKIPVNEVNDFCKSLADSWWLFDKDNTHLTIDTGTKWKVISTSFLGLFNDSIELYVKPSRNQIIISDVGETINNLDRIGLSLLASEYSKNIFNDILLNYDIQLNGSELFTVTDKKGFSQKIVNFISAMIAINNDSQYSIKQGYSHGKRHTQ